MIGVAKRLAETDQGALSWLDKCSTGIGKVLAESDLIAPSQVPLLFTSVQEMKADMVRNKLDTANYALEDLGLFASPDRALKLSTLHYAKGREDEAVAMINLHEGSIPFFLARAQEDFDEARRLFYVGATRAKRLLMYVTDYRNSRNRPTRFLGSCGIGHLR